MTYLKLSGAIRLVGKEADFLFGDLYSAKNESTELRFRTVSTKENGEISGWPAKRFNLKCATETENDVKFRNGKQQEIIIYAG